ncbi:tetratricopeptide repeat protein [Ekhidna sp.]|uniref:tetratricopeptide repeat protein n=1 Tax=Ekhidna sp. TaxID=2608089 RepID=UPI003BAC70A0
MKKFNLAMALAAGVVLLSGCKLDKMIKLAQENDLQVDPNPLEVHGGDIPFDMSAVLPPKMLPASASFTLNTIYVYGDQEVSVGSIEFKASDFPNSSSTTSRKSANFSFPYQDGMNPGTLYVQGVATDTRNGKSKSTDRMAVAQGLIMTSGWVKDVAMVSYTDHGYNDKEELIPTNVNFYFDQGRASLRTSLSYDGVTNRSKRDELSAFIAEKNVTRTVTITGTHSPEGTETINSDLSENRAKEIEKFYRDRMDRYDYKGAADSIDFILKPVIQDWRAFKAALATYDGISTSEKAEYNNIINGSGSFVEKEKEMQKLSTYKKVFNDVYPGLRSAQTQVLTVKPKKSNAQIAVLAKAIVDGSASADTLTIEELMFSATLTPSLEEKAAIYKAAADKSGMWQAHNNLAATHIEMAKRGDASKLDGAATQLEIAMNKMSSAAEVQANMGAVQILQGDYAAAYETLGNVSSSSNDINGKVNSMKGAVEVRMAEYDKAKASFASAKNSENVMIDRGLAYLLTGDYSMADAEFKQVMRADAYYLLAVSAARQNNASEVGSNLKKAVDAEPSYKDMALNDLEFTNYADAVNEAVK